MSTYGSNFTPKDTPRVDFVKDRLMIVIFGSYDEDTDALERLVGFKEFLQSIGYTGTRFNENLFLFFKITFDTNCKLEKVANNS